MAALPNSAALETVLARGDVWRGNALAALPDATVASGFPELDAELPGGGWPCGNLTEMLVDREGLGELSLWLPALARLSGQGGRIALVAPPFVPYAPAWRSAGIAPERLVVVQPPAAGRRERPAPRTGRMPPKAPDEAWCCEQLLACGGFAAVLAWLGEGSDERCLRRLQVAVADKPMLACLWRSGAARRQSSPAPLRLAVDVPEGPFSGLRLSIVKRRGRPASQPLSLCLPRAGGKVSEQVSRALARPRLAVPAARRAGAAAVA